jgi:hypothetical protein
MRPSIGGPLDWKRMAELANEQGSTESSSPPDETRYAEVGRAVLANFEERNARARAAGDALRDEIKRVLNSHTGPEPLTAKRILRRISLERIGRASLPSERTVHWHLQRIRAEQSQAVGVASQPDAL